MSEYNSEKPSPRFTLLGELYRQVHETGLEKGTDAAQVFGGGSLLQHISIVEKLTRHTDAKSVLDYGSGKGLLYGETNLKLPDGTVIPSVKEFWGVETLRLYDPGVEAFATRPDSSFDGVISTDVLEHIPGGGYRLGLGGVFWFCPAVSLHEHRLLPGRQNSTQRLERSRDHSTARMVAEAHRSRRPKLEGPSLRF